MRKKSQKKQKIVQSRKGILSMLDYRISLGSRDSEQDTEEQNP